jgi:cell division protease FtsH
VSILARGGGLGITALQRDTSDSILFTASQLYSRLVTEVAGLAAESLAFGEISTGAERDLEHATEIARDMVARYGMSPTLGRPRLIASDADRFLGSEGALAQVSLETVQELDREVRRLMDRAEADAAKILKANRRIVDAMANRLETEESLEGLPLEAILKKVPVSAAAGLEPFPGNGTRVRSRKPANRE